MLANVYVPTAKIAKMMQGGEIAGCGVSDEFVRRLEGEKKPQRLERAARMVAAARDLGFAGAHIGGFGLAHNDFQAIVERAAAIGAGWRESMEELVWASEEDFYLFRAGGDGLSDGASGYQISSERPRPSMAQRLSATVYEHFIEDGSAGSRFFAPRLRPTNDGRHGRNTSANFWARLLAPASLYRKATLGYAGCGDCVQDHLNYAGCSMRWCYKELRNGPCGGSRPDGNCEAHPELECVWNLIYQGALAMGDDPDKFARVLIPPRDWGLNRSNALVNRFAGLDNFPRRKRLRGKAKQKQDAQPC